MRPAVRGVMHEGLGAESDVRFGSEADMCSAIGHVRFAPNSDRKSGPPKIAMSALDLKADVCGATAHVGFGPIADIGSAIRFDQSKCNIVVNVHGLALPAHRFR